MKRKGLLCIVGKEIYKLLEPVLFFFIPFLCLVFSKEYIQQYNIPFLNTAIHILCFAGIGVSVLWFILQIVISVYDVRQKIELEEIKEDKE